MVNIYKENLKNVRFSFLLMSSVDLALMFVFNLELNVDKKEKFAVFKFADKKRVIFYSLG